MYLLSCIDLYQQVSIKSNKIYILDDEVEMNIYNM